MVFRLLPGIPVGPGIKTDEATWLCTLYCIVPHHSGLLIWDGPFLARLVGSVRAISDDDGDDVCVLDIAVIGWGCEIRSFGFAPRSPSGDEGAARELWPADNRPDPRDAVHDHPPSGDPAGRKDPKSKATAFRRNVQRNHREFPWWYCPNPPHPQSPSS